MAGTEKPALGDTVVSARAAAALIGVTHPRVLQLTTEGWIKKNSKGQHTLQGVVGGYVAFLKAEERRTSKAQSESGLKAARQREVELRIQRQEHRLCETEDALGIIDEVVGAYRSELSGLPARVTRDIPLRRKIETEVNGILQRVSKLFAKRANALRTGGETFDTDAEDAPG